MCNAANGAGGEFNDEDVARCYAFRAPYPETLHERLAGLAAGRARLLDLGCGPGKLARALAGRFDAIDAVDRSHAMLAAGRELDSGRHPHINWIEARAEDIAFDGPYDLAVAGASIHWMRHDIVMPKLARALRQGAPLALVDGDGPSQAPWMDAYQTEVIRWVERSGRRWQDRAHRDLVTAHLPWIDIEGLETFTITVRQKIEDLIEAEHSRATWARSRMGAETAEAFDASLRAILEPAAIGEAVEYVARSTIVWGRPRLSPRPTASGSRG